MSAFAKLDESSSLRNSQVPRTGVVALYGYGIRASVDRGHLILEDGIGRERRYWRLPRIRHGLQRLVVIGADGCISLAALRWLSDQNSAFVMLDRDGSVLATTGPVRPSDARLRRAQALAAHTGADVTISRRLIEEKLAQQERVAREQLWDEPTANFIGQCRSQLAHAETQQQIRTLESQGAATYWALWRDLPITFPRNDLPRTPEHWRTFGPRKSPLTGSPRLACNPANAVLNYVYAIVESESRLAAAALGLDPGLGFLHVDTPARDSLACDLMEPIRPLCDAWVLDWIQREPLSRNWFFEQRDGNCRLMGDFAARLAQTAPHWGRAVAPFAEWVARTLWKRNSAGESGPATRLTQQRRREVKGSDIPSAKALPRPQTLCKGCGKEIVAGRSHCAKCAVPLASARLVAATGKGRAVAHSLEARTKEGNKQKWHANARSAWVASDLPSWLNEEVFAQKIQPVLTQLSNSTIANRIGVSRWYAGRIRNGYRPHVRHWQVLASLVGVREC